MSEIKKYIESIRESLADLFTFDPSHKEIEYIFINHIHTDDPIRTDWENIGKDIDKSMSEFDYLHNIERLETNQISLNFDNDIDNHGEEEHEKGQPA